MMDIQKLEFATELAKMTNEVSGIKVVELDGKLSLHIEINPPPEAYEDIKLALQAIVHNFTGFAVNVIHNIAEDAIDN